MNRTLISLTLINFFFIHYGQTVPDHPDLGLNGAVTWIDSTHIKVEYDWSNDTQLLDWEMTSESTLERENGLVTIINGSASVRAMIWKQGIKCNRIFAKDAEPLTSAGHLNFYSNLTSFTGNTWLPDPGLGAVLATTKNFWAHDGVDTGNIGAAYLVEDVARDYEYTASVAGMTIKSSVDNVVYSYNTPCVPELDRKIAIGGWGGNTRWGKITIEGEVTIPWQEEPVPSDVINIQSNGAVFAPVIEVIGTPAIEWFFYDSTTSSSTSPTVNYGSIGTRHNYLKVTPWSALIGINVGYDAADGGYGGFDIIADQDVLGFQNLTLAKSGLQYLCASYNPITELDLRELTALKFVELFKCQYLDTLRLGSYPVLERLCVEDCDLDSLDLSGCAALEDLRGALNDYTSINWDSIGQSLWHICIRDNPQITVNIPALTQFPVLRELLTYNTNQTGVFVCHSSEIKVIESYSNHYTSADINGCTSLRRFWLSGSQLASLDLGTANNLIDIELTNCGLTESQTDYVLHTLDGAGRSDGYLELTGNAAPSAEGLIHRDSLEVRGWTILNETPVSLDCNGDENGLAFIDSCGICAGGNTGITPILDKDECSFPMDCNGDENGLAFIDSCGICAGGNTGITPILDKDECSFPTDCNGDENGLAFIDSCGICAGGNTDIIPILAIEECLNQRNDIKQLYFRIFPNPNDGLLHIVCSEPLPFQIMVIDLVGKVVLEDNFNGNTTIDTYHLMVGYYEVVIKIRDEIIRQKLIIL